MKTPPRIDKTQDYTDFERHLVTFESVPSVDGGLLPDIHGGGLEAKMKFNQISLDLITNEKGEDIVGKQVNPSYEQDRAEHFGTFEGNQSPTNIFQMAESFKNESLASTSEMDVYCAVIGIAFEQDAVPYMKAEQFSNSAKDMHFGLQLEFEESIGPERFDQLAKLFQEYANGVEFTVVGDKSLRAVNFRDDGGIPFAMSDTDFIKKVIKVAEKFPSNEEVSISRMGVKGNYIFNDWNEDPNGENYKTLLKSNGREDLVLFAEELRGRFLEKVRDFSNEMSMPEKTAKRQERDLDQLSM